MKRFKSFLVALVAVVMFFSVIQSADAELVPVQGRPGVYFDKDSIKLYVSVDGSVAPLWNVADLLLKYCNQRMTQHKEEICAQSANCTGDIMDCMDKTAACIEVGFLTVYSANFQECTDFLRAYSLCSDFCRDNAKCQSANYCAGSSSSSSSGGGGSGSSGGHRVGCTAECSRDRSNCSKACSFGPSEGQGECMDECWEIKRRCDSGCD